MVTATDSQAEAPAFCAVVAAAGPGTRMGRCAPAGGDRADEPSGGPGWPALPLEHVRKPYLPLDGVPVLIHSLARFRQARGFAGAVLAVHPRDHRAVSERWGARLEAEFAVAAIVPGAAMRQESVLGALEATDPAVGLVLIHDAARPLVEVSVIEAVAARAAERGAAIAAVPAVATVKQVGPGGAIRHTPPREHLWMAQTPQGFRRDLILQAHRRARDEGFVGTDDSLLVERLGHPVEVVPDSTENLKITTPADLVAAEAILRWRKGPAGPRGS